MVLIDPSAERLMHISSELLSAQDRIRRQQRTIWALASALRASQRQQGEMLDLLEAVLADG